MHLHSHMRLSAFAGLALLYTPCASADDQTPVGHAGFENVPLSQEDLRSITAQVMAKQPLLSSGRGIKFAEAVRVDESEEEAVVVYYPHSESAGIKEAFQVRCGRQAADMPWACEDARIRRYLTLDTQDFEVRITGPIESNAAIALIEATRKVLPLVTDEGFAVPDTVTQVCSYDDSASVVWGSSKGNASLLMQGRLAEGGDPAKPDDWIVHRFDLHQVGLE